MQMPANRIRELREGKELSHAEVAAVCEVREITVQRWERGESAVPDTQKFRLAKLFEVEVAYLMGWDHNGVEAPA